MSDARSTIFDALEAARPPQADPPRALIAPEMPPDPLSVLADRVEQSGGRLQDSTRTNWPAEIDWPIPLAEVSDLYVAAPFRSEIAPRGVGGSEGSLRALADLDVCVLKAEFAVVENGACWQVPASPWERAAALLAQHLLILVPRTDIVPSLHQAYERIDLAGMPFGWFLCGPSKTADIEQALVLGAHGPRTMSLVLLS